jgi:hypothetical protein
MGRANDEGDWGVGPDASVMELLDRVLGSLRDVQEKLDYLNISVPSAHINDAIEALNREVQKRRSSVSLAKLD